MISEKPLERYFKILSGKEKPKFKIAREKNVLKRKVEEAYKILNSCELCERKCKIDRISGERGFCKVGDKSIISSAFVHVGEEPFLVPSYTIFFMGCTFECQYCQNWTISQWYEGGREVTPTEIAEMIDANSSCMNVNFVGGEPTPHLPFILDSLQHVKSDIPVVWNSNFYMSEKSMKLLEGVVDVYLSDWKYGNDECAGRLSKVKNYWSVVKRNHNLAFKDSTLVIRHLVLPNHYECCTKPILKYISKKFGDKVIVNIMGQYRPEWRAYQFEDISRYLTIKELERAWKLAEELNLNFLR